MKPVLLALGIAIAVLACWNTVEAGGRVVQPVIYSYLPPGTVYAHPAPIVTIPVVPVPAAIAAPTPVLAPVPLYPGRVIIRVPGVGRAVYRTW
jgi:hypothetical protein